VPADQLVGDDPLLDTVPGVTGEAVRVACGRAGRVMQPALVVVVQLGGAFGEDDDVAERPPPAGVAGWTSTWPSSPSFSCVGLDVLPAAKQAAGECAGEAGARVNRPELLSITNNPSGMANSSRSNTRSYRSHIARFGLIE
jgi:hypothetical protein